MVARASSSKKRLASHSKAAAWQQSDSEEDEAGPSSPPSQEDSGSEGVEADEEARRPTFAQFQGESDLEDEDDESEAEQGQSEEQSSSEEGDSDDDAHAARREEQLRKSMQNIPFAALLKAKRKLASNDDGGDFGGHASGSELSDEEDEWAEERARAAVKQQKKRDEIKAQLRQMKDRNAGEAPAESDSRPKHGSDRHASSSSRDPRSNPPPTRSSKHAPTEQSSRRPVSRKRSVIETGHQPSSASSRDPRFSTLSGPAVNKGVFQQSYSFLDSVHASEMSDLRSTLSRLRKLEAANAGPKSTSEQALAIRAQREDVERTLKRQEAKAAERAKRAREDEVLGQFKRENEQRVKEGGKRFYLKSSDKKDLLLKDKFQRLAGNKRPSAATAAAVAGPNGQSRGAVDGPSSSSSSSSKALRKALDKRRKKNAQKERKDLPWLDARGGGGGSGGGGLQPPRKRRA